MEVKEPTTTRTPFSFSKHQIKIHPLDQLLNASKILNIPIQPTAPEISSWKEDEENLSKLLGTSIKKSHFTNLGGYPSVTTTTSDCPSVVANTLGYPSVTIRSNYLSDRPLAINDSQPTTQSAKWWPNSISSIIASIINFDKQTPQQCPFLFKLTTKAAHKNLCVLQKYNNNLGTAIDSNKNSPISYGSKFRSTTILAPLLHVHPQWHLFKSLLKVGLLWPLLEITEQQKLDDVDKALTFTNHKGANLNKDLLKTLIKEDVNHGFILPLTLDKIKQIPGVLLAPLNIINQNTIDEIGHAIQKDRLTHDQSFVSKVSNSSVKLNSCSAHLVWS